MQAEAASVAGSQRSRRGGYRRIASSPHVEEELFGTRKVCCRRAFGACGGLLAHARPLLGMVLQSVAPRRDLQRAGETITRGFLDSTVDPAPAAGVPAERGAKGRTRTPAAKAVADLTATTAALTLSRTDIEDIKQRAAAPVAHRMTATHSSPVPASNQTRDEERARQRKERMIALEAERQVRACCCFTLGSRVVLFVYFLARSPWYLRTALFIAPP